MRTIDALLTEQSARLAGRSRERAVLRKLVEHNRPLVVFVHGLAGVGKSTLLRAAEVDARASGVSVVRLDCQAVEPTERGVLESLAASVEAPHPTMGAVADAHSRLGRRVLVTLDSYEVFRPLDDWVRATLVPSLGANVRLILAGRDEPVTAWPATFGPLFTAVPLENLSPEEAEDLLRQEGLGARDAARVNRLARGHPLALRLSAAALRAQPELELETLTVRTVVREITGLYLAGLDSATREALDAASVVRRPTRSLLAAMLPGTSPDVVFDRLRELPFVTLDPDGLVLHDTIREVVAAALRADDPVAHRAYRVAAWRQLRGELRLAQRRQLWRYTADTLYLLENPILREGYFPRTDRAFVIETATPDDAPAIHEIVERHETPTALVLLERWWDERRESFRVARDRRGEVAGVLCMCEIDAIPYGLVEADPVATAWRDHLRRYPVSRGQRVLATRFRLARESGEAVSPAQAALWLEITRLALELRPELRRRYTVFRDFTAFGPILAPLGFEELPGSPITIDRVAHHIAVLDFGAASVDGWLAGMVAAELNDDGGAGVLDVNRRQLVVDGLRTDLTRLEFELLRYLEQREGQVVGREAILRDVWGYEFEGSNVIEAAVSALRRKLGDHSWMIETVRGVGYRFCPRQLEA